MLEFQTMLVSGVTAGAVITYCAYRFTGRRGDDEDLLGEICEERASLCRVMAALPEQLELAKRTKMIEADGLPTSDATARWLREFESDYADAKSLESQVPDADVVEADHTGMELDLRLAEILTLSIRAQRLAEKYPSSPKVEVHFAVTGADVGMDVNAHAHTDAGSDIDADTVANAAVAHRHSLRPSVRARALIARSL